VSVASTEYQVSQMMNHRLGDQHEDKVIKQLRPYTSSKPVYSSKYCS